MKSEVTALAAVYGLEDLIAGVTPTYSGWTVDPTDGANITDGDITTFCNTGNKVTGGGWQYAYFEWDLGAFYNILCTGVGNSTATAGSPYTYLTFWNGVDWDITSTNEIGRDWLRTYIPHSIVTSKIRLGITSTEAATITPNVRDFYVWRLE